MKSRAPAVLLLSWLALSIPAWSGEMKGACDIRFEGTSTLHDFAGTVRCQPFRVSLVPVADGGTVIPAFQAAVLVAEMDTANSGRDEKMREMFEIEKFPQILARFAEIDADAIRQEMRDNPPGKGTLEFILRIRDLERPIRVAVSGLSETPGQIGFEGEFPVSLKEFGLEPPSPLFGLIHVGDTVTVHATVRLEPEAGE